MISGKCLTLAENRPTSGATIEVYQVDDSGDTIEPMGGTFTVNPAGFWGPLEVKPGKHYLFKVSTANPGFRRVIYYYQPFIRHNAMLYLRTFPPPLSLAGLLLSSIPNNDSQSVVSIFTSNQAVIHGRDQLSLDSFDLSTPALASESASMIALFCYDNGVDGSGNGEPIANFLAFPFLQGADLPLVPVPTQTYTLQFNGSVLPVRNWRSQSDGVVIAVFSDPDAISSAEPQGRGLVDHRLHLYPNPASSEVYVEVTKRSIHTSMMTLSGFNGQLAPLRFSATGDNQIRLETGHLANGLYVLSVYTPDGRMSGTFQVLR